MAKRKRHDYKPGPAAQQALEIAAKQWPELRSQEGKIGSELIDKLVIYGLSAFMHQWKPPPLQGQDRDRWRLPPGLCPVEPDGR